MKIRCIRKVIKELIRKNSPLLATICDFWAITSETYFEEISKRLFNHQMIGSSYLGKNRTLEFLELRGLGLEEREKVRSRGLPRWGSEAEFSVCGLHPATWVSHAQSCQASPLVSIVYQASSLKYKNDPQLRATGRIQHPPSCNFIQPGNRRRCAVMLGLGLAFVFCLPQLTKLSAREQVRIKPPSAWVHITVRQKVFLAIWCPLLPQVEGIAARPSVL